MAGLFIKNPQSICVLRLSAIGDVCNATATVQAIQKCHPQAELTWIIGKTEARLLQDLPNINFVIFDKAGGITAYFNLWRKLRGKKFDLLLHMQVALRSSLVTLCVKAEEKWGFDRRRAKEGQWLFTNRYISQQSEPHVAEGFWGFAIALGVSPESPPEWDIPINSKDEKWCSELTKDKPFIVISPAASQVERNWLESRYAALADFGYGKGFDVYLCGGSTKAEKLLTKGIMATVSTPVTNLVGKTSLSQLLALISRATLILAPDSGPVHMANAVNTPVVGLYAHSNPNRTGPYHSRENCVSVYEPLLIKQTGETVSKNHWGKRVKGDNLMALISVNQVESKFEQIISE